MAWTTQKNLLSSSEEKRGTTSARRQVKVTDVAMLIPFSVTIWHVEVVDETHMKVAVHLFFSFKHI